MTWTSGYRADITYTHGYYAELNPGMIDFALLMAGYQPPDRAGDGAGMRYLELGYGQGVTLNIVAAGAAGAYWGTDFNPAHAAHARALAQASGANARWLDDSFSELAAREDLPEFDYIVMHGVWSWISDDNRGAIVDILRRRLKVGGALYISYNALPGWATTLPIRQLMKLHADGFGGAAQGVAAQIDAALAFTTRLADAGGGFFASGPRPRAVLDSMAGLARNYLAHEHLNRDLAPMYFCEVSDLLARAKLTHAAPANLLDQIDAVNLGPAQIEFLGATPAGPLRETVRDYLLNQPFRKDLFTRGARRLSPLERRERLEAVRLAPTTPVSDVPLKVDTALGSVGLREDIYRPLVEALAADGGVAKTIAQLAVTPSLAGLRREVLLEGVAVLVGTGRAHPALDAAGAEAAAPRAARLNAHLLDRARSGGEITHLASPVTGSGAGVSRFDQLFLSARGRGLATPEAWAADAWSVLASQDQSLIVDGQVLATPEANLEALTAQARTLASDRLELLRRLRVVD